MYSVCPEPNRKNLMTGCQNMHAINSATGKDVVKTRLALQTFYQVLT